MVTVVTHSGDFHPDDVFAVATAELFYEEIEVIRSREQETIDCGDVVVDVGGEYDPSRLRFDHHQKGGAGERKNGIPYAAFGLVWKHFGTKLCKGNEDVKEAIDARLVAPLDAHDNGVNISKEIFEGVRNYTLGDVAWIFRPTWKEEYGDKDTLFLEAVALAKKLIRREIQNHMDRFEGYEMVREAYRKAEDKRIIILEKNYPWEEVLVKYPEPLFCVYPKEGGWRVKAVRKDMNSFENRKDFPKEWGGRPKVELQDLTGVTDVEFVHRAGFLAGAESKEGALKLAIKALE